MSICSSCPSVLKENGYLRCNACKSNFCLLCLNFDSDTNPNSLKPEQSSKLRCPSCINVNAIKRNRGDNTPVESPKETGFTAPVGLRTSSKPSQLTQQESVTLSLSDISSLLDSKLAPNSTAMINLRAAWREDVKSMIAAEINSAVKQIKEDFNSTTDFIMGEVTDLKSKVKEKDAIIKKLEDKQCKLEKDCMELRTQLTSIEKLSRACNVELQAVPEKSNENLIDTFKNLCEIVNAAIPDSEIKACRRVAKVDVSSKRPRNIIITLGSSRLRDDLLSACHRYNKQHPNDKLSSKHIGVEGGTCNIYVSRTSFS